MEQMKRLQNQEIDLHGVKKFQKQTKPLFTMQNFVLQKLVQKTVLYLIQVQERIDV